MVLTSTTTTITTIWRTAQINRIQRFLKDTTWKIRKANIARTLPLRDLEDNRI
jgi:hypothetical protein